MQLDPPILSCVCGPFVVVVCCITYVASYKWNRSRQDGGANLYPLQLVNFLEKNNTFLKIA